MSEYKRLTTKGEVNTGLTETSENIVDNYEKIVKDKIENEMLVKLPCKGIEESDIIKDGMIFILYKMCLEQKLVQRVFLEYKSKINEWFKNYLKNKELQEKG